MPSFREQIPTLVDRCSAIRESLPSFSACWIPLGSLLACVIGLLLIDHSYQRDLDLARRELRSHELISSQKLLSQYVLQLLSQRELPVQEIRKNLSQLNEQHQQVIDTLIGSGKSHPFAFRPQLQQVIDLTPLVSDFTARARTILSGVPHVDQELDYARQDQLELNRALQFLSFELSRRPEHLSALGHLGWLFRPLSLLGICCFLVPALLAVRLQRQNRREAARLSARGDEILATKRHLLSAIGATAGGLWSWTLETDELWTNHEFWKLLGYRRKNEFPHNQISSFRDHVHPKDRAPLDAAIEKHLRTRKPLDIEVRFWHLEAEHRWVRLRAHAERTRTGKPLRLSGVIEDIHAHKLAELQLQDREQEMERLALVAQHTTNGVVISNARGEVEWVNEGFVRLTGYALEDMLGRKPGSVLQGPNTDQETIAEIRRCVAAGTSFKAELVNYSKSGKEYWVRIEADPIHNERDELIGFIAIQSDISERIKFAQELATSREQLKNVLEHLPVAAYTCDPDGLITYFNQAAVKLWGRKPNLNDPQDRFCGSFKLFDMNGQMIEANDCFMAVALKEPGSHLTGEVMLETPAGERKTAIAYTKSLTNGDNEVMGGVNVVVDLSERIALEQSLRETTARLAICLRILDEHAIVAETDLNGTIRHVNDFFCEVSGYSREELLGSNHRILNSGYHPKEMWKEVFRQISRTGIWQGEICNRRKNGDLYWVDTTIAAMHDASGRPNGYFAIRNDITELKAAKEAALAASNSKSEFLANMSHEIRTPLTAILGYAEMLRDDADLANAPEKRAHAVNTIHEAGRHLLTVINDILDLSKIEAGKMSIEQTDTAIANILSQIESFLRPRAIGKGLSLTTRLATPIPDRIQSDPTRMRQILMNLAGNAIKFTEAGHIEVTVSIVENDGTEFLQFDIEDSGTGMTEEQRSQIFQAFSQADNSVTRQHGGTGLGLVICRRLARLMGGDVWLLWTESGRGSCFRVELPCIPLADATFVDNLVTLDPPDTSAPRADQPSFPFRILLAEDGPDNQRLISFMLRKLGATVEIADNGAEALRRLRDAAAAKNSFDILITDIQMPEMDGYTLTRTLRNDGWNLPILALTAHAMPEDRQKCLAAGCDQFLTKPVKKSDLIHALEQLITGRSERDDESLEWSSETGPIEL